MWSTHSGCDRQTDRDGQTDGVQFCDAGQCSPGVLRVSARRAACILPRARLVFGSKRCSYMYGQSCPFDDESSRRCSNPPQTESLANSLLVARGEAQRSRKNPSDLNMPGAGEMRSMGLSLLLEGAQCVASDNASKIKKIASEEGLTLLVANNRSGYFGVCLDPRTSKPYEARVRRDGKEVGLGRFSTAEEASLCVARTPEGQEAAKRPVAAVPLTKEEALRQAEADGLTLRLAKNNTGYAGVCLDLGRNIKPFAAQVKNGQKLVHLGRFATAEEAALCVARSPEAKAAAALKAAAPPPIPFMTSEEARLLADPNP